jgi:hypothetical protein
MAELERLNPEHARIAANVLVNGKRFSAQLDTGAHTSIITRQAAETVGAGPGQAGTIPAGAVAGLAARPIESWIGTFASFGIGDESMRNVQLQIADLFSADATVDLGSRLRRPLEDTPSMLVGIESWYWPKNTRCYSHTMAVRCFNWSNRAPRRKAAPTTVRQGEQRPLQHASGYTHTAEVAGPVRAHEQ